MSGRDCGDASVSWHDDTVYGLHLRPADPDRGDWRHELWLDIDHIVEWVCGADGGASFRVAPATLVFHEVTDLSLAIDFGETGHATAINEMSIDHIACEPVQPVCAIKPIDYWRWRIALNWPKGGEIGFGASRYDLALRADPVETDQQRLAPGARAPFVMGGPGPA